MYGLEVRIGSERGLVALPVYRALLEEVRSLLIDVDQQSRQGRLQVPVQQGSEAAAVTWAVRHEAYDAGLRLRWSPSTLRWISSAHFAQRKLSSGGCTNSHLVP